MALFSLCDVWQLILRALAIGSISLPRLWQCNLLGTEFESDGKTVTLGTAEIMDRRTFIRRSASAAGILLLPHLIRSAHAIERIEKMNKTDAQWKKLLTSEQYDVLRQEGTERPFSSSLNHETRSGQFVCVACGLPLFLSKYKFDSGTGWPSFYDTLPGSVESKTDFKLVVPRTEYHCARCGGHHGHVFNDGPKPTGLRYCNNGLVLRFLPDQSKP